MGGCIFKSRIQKKTGTIEIVPGILSSYNSYQIKTVYPTYKPAFEHVEKYIDACEGKEINIVYNIEIENMKSSVHDEAVSRIYLKPSILNAILSTRQKSNPIDFLKEYFESVDKEILKIIEDIGEDDL